MKNQKDLVEIFGHHPEDTSKEARLLWKLEACPFTGHGCTKINHDRTVVYGTCSVSSPFGDTIICPNRLYANDYEVIRRIANVTFGEIPFFFFEDYIKNRHTITTGVVALGKNSGREVKIGQSLSMDWVLAYFDDSQLIEYVGIEVQSIDITGNYRDAWHYYNALGEGKKLASKPSSGHGLNWANVHKRLIPQLIRKGRVYSRSEFVKKGLFFVVPEIVFLKFEEVIGKDIPIVDSPSKDTITVLTLGLDEVTKDKGIRELCLIRTLSFTLDEFSLRFVTGADLPTGELLDAVILKALGLQK